MVETRAVTGGVDTHAEVHVAAALDSIGGLLGVAEFPAAPAGYARLLAWLGGFGQVCLVGVEGTGSCGAGLARHLAAAGIWVPADGSRPARQLTLPRGWFVASNGGIGGGAANVGAVGDRLLVQSSDYQDSPQPDTLGLWRPGAHQVWVLGRAASANYAVIGAVTVPGSAGGLVAWIPASCGLFRWTCIKITNTADMSSLTVRAPTRYGFALGGAFTPDGRGLAAFTVTGIGGRHFGPAAGLTVINTRTGAVRAVAHARYQIGAATLWAAPVPGNDQVLAGGLSKAYAVDPATLTTRLLPGKLSQDLNYSTVVFTSPR